MLLLPCVAAQEASSAAASLIIPDGTPIQLRLDESVSSAHARVGDPLDFVVVRDVNVAGFTVIPAGTRARGSITKVKGRRLLARGGQIWLQLDSVKLANGDQVHLRASRKVTGASRTVLMLGGMIASALIFLPAAPVFLLTRGHDSILLKSTEIVAQIEGAPPVLSAELPRSQKDSSELTEMMDYLPPRILNREGREGDMVNLVFVAEPNELQQAFQRAGWVKTDGWKPTFVWHLARHGTSDATLPMARFYLFGRVQDYSYALPDPDAIMSRRHHLRIWKTDYKINGTPIWAGSATRDVAIIFAKHGRLINHRIDPEVDAERDFVGTDLTETSSVSGREFLQSTDPVFQAETTSGESYHSDSRILLIDLRPVDAGNATAQTSAGGRATILPVSVSPEGLESPTFPR